MTVYFKVAPHNEPSLNRQFRILESNLMTGLSQNIGTYVGFSETTGFGLLIDYEVHRAELTKLQDRIAELEEQAHEMNEEFDLAIRLARENEARDERGRCLQARPITTAAIPPGEPGHNRDIWLHERAYQQALDEWEQAIRALGER